MPSSFRCGNNSSQRGVARKCMCSGRRADPGSGRRMASARRSARSLTVGGYSTGRETKASPPGRAPPRPHGRLAAPCREQAVHPAVDVPELKLTPALGVELDEAFDLGVDELLVPLCHRDDAPATLKG